MICTPQNALSQTTLEIESLPLLTQTSDTNLLISISERICFLKKFYLEAACSIVKKQCFGSSNNYAAINFALWCIFLRLILTQNNSKIIVHFPNQILALSNCINTTVLALATNHQLNLISLMLSSRFMLIIWKYFT